MEIGTLKKGIICIPHVMVSTDLCTWHSADPLRSPLSFSYFIIPEGAVVPVVGGPWPELAELYQPGSGSDSL